MTAITDLEVSVLLDTEVTIRNIVANIDLDVEIDLSYLATKIPNSTYEPERYPSLVYRPTDSSSTVMVTNTGKLLFTGGSSVSDVLSAYYSISRELRNVGLENTGKKENLVVNNIVSTVELPMSLDLPALSIKLGMENTEYEPEQFPGLIFRLDNGPVALFFSSGNVVITGTKSVTDISDAVEKIQDIVSS